MKTPSGGVTVGYARFAKISQWTRTNVHSLAVQAFILDITLADDLIVWLSSLYDSDAGKCITLTRMTDDTSSQYGEVIWNELL